MPLGTDIFTVVKSNQPIKNGSVIAGVDKQGTIQEINPDSGKNHVPQSGAMENKYTNRWDDPTYYTA